MQRLLPEISTFWDTKDVENFDDPTIRLVGCKFEGENGKFTPYENVFLANDEWFLGYERWYKPEYEQYSKYFGYIANIKVGDVLIMHHKFGSSTHVKTIAIGIVVYTRDLPVIDSNGEPTGRTFKAFKMAWTNKNINIDLPNKGFWDKGGSATQGYKKSEILQKRIPDIKEKSVEDVYTALMKEVDKARFRFLRSQLSNITSKSY